MSKEQEIAILELRKKDYENQLSILCDEDYYHCCDMIQQLELQIQELKTKE